MMINVMHHFDLKGMKLSDWFLGCSHCWFQAPANSATKPVCPNCSKAMYIYDVKQSDLEEV